MISERTPVGYVYKTHKFRELLDSIEAPAVALIYGLILSRSKPSAAATGDGTCVSLGCDLAAHLGINNQAGDLADFGDGVAT